MSDSLNSNSLLAFVKKPFTPGNITLRQPTPRQRTWLFRIAVTVLILNLLDGVLTLALVQGGLASEANPLMDELLGHGAVFFMLFKIVLVSLSVLLLWRLQQLRIACIAMYGALATYGLIAINHLQSVDILVRYIG